MKHHYVRKKEVDHETYINTVRAVIDDNCHLFTRALEVLLHIPQVIIHHILIEKLEMVHVVSTWVPTHVHKRSNANPYRKCFNISGSHCGRFNLPEPSCDVL